MYTIKQMEAFCWSATLGSFAAASKQLFTTQSTVAKRVAELEGFVGAPLFERKSKTLQLTEVGQRLLTYGQEMLDLHMKVVHALADKSGFEGRVRIGATDLVGLTWLPMLIQSIRLQFPKVQVEPEIDGGIRLYERLGRNEIDIAIMPGPFASPTFDSRLIGSVENVWMASPGFQVETKELSPADVSRLPVIVQPAASALTQLYQSWFRDQGFELQQVLTCNSLGMVAQLTIYGLGLSYLPRLYFEPLVKDGRLRIVPVHPPLPPVTYYAFFRKNDQLPVLPSILSIAEQVADFGMRM
ncbi:LysR family transcriptional regulator [Agaricicola taiwanensis]|uniref:LysR family transcriptional regulator n=1 Tax=Agaricicola taiwanensis TaxID=591372 RepID=A0A8J2YM29_9RHOB|nr:LysR family transcriptional regulator [Agaricicola taiwanensis]GGE53139.1 LysR family transcriptional regulator [Agaricicola taiwanensis]